MTEIPIVTIIAKSGSGKTTLMEKLIVELKSRGYRLATIKHHSHSGFEVDKPGKDSWRFGQAGSDHVIIAAPDKIASYRKLDHELSLDEVMEHVSGVDLVLVEGYKRAGKPAIEIVREAHGTELIGGEEQLVAVASDTPLDVHVPILDLNDIVKVADFVENTFIKGHV
ncbi:molybdopterin-guanine dinucleotide biosynthesis protein B [bacterium]|nr:molybdopterin-guanine dinucleotide biosynthesis protein B [bacterium]